MAQGFATSTTRNIIAGDEDNEHLFIVEKEILEKSPVIKEWIEDPDSLKESWLKNGALYLKTFDPEVVRTMISYLQSGEPSDFDGLHGKNPLFYVRLYKLAGSLALDTLCSAALKSLQTRKYDPETFISIAVEVEKGQLIEAKAFRDWMVGYMSQNSDSLKESQHIQGAINEGGVKAWAIFSALMGALSYLDGPGGPQNVLLSPPTGAGRRKSNPMARNRTPYSRSAVNLKSGLGESKVGDGAARVRHEGRRRNMNPSVKDADE